MKIQIFTTDINKIQKIISFYLKNLYSTNSENIKEMNGFLGAYELIKLSQNQMNNLKRSIITSE